MKIREFTELDLADCIRLGREMVDYHRQIYEDNSIPYGDEELREKLTRRDANWLKFVAIEEGRVVGLLILTIKEERGGTCEIDYIVVAKDKRGKGIGRALINHAKKVALEKGCQEITAKVAARNVQAIKFYNRNGLNCLGMIEVFAPLTNERKKQWYVMGKRTKFLGLEHYY